MSLGLLETQTSEERADCHHMELNTGITAISAPDFLSLGPIISPDHYCYQHFIFICVYILINTNIKALEIHNCDIVTIIEKERSDKALAPPSAAVSEVAAT